MSDYGIKISEAGSEADTAEFEDLIASSKYPTPKIKIGQTNEHFGSGEYTVPSTGTSTLTVLNIPHGYDYTPAVMCLVSTGFGVWRPAPCTWFFSGPTIDAYCTDTHFKLEINSDRTNANGLTLEYRYYILDRNGT